LTSAKEIGMHLRVQSTCLRTQTTLPALLSLRYTSIAKRGA